MRLLDEKGKEVAVGRQLLKSNNNINLTLLEVLSDVDLMSAEKGAFYGALEHNGEKTEIMVVSATRRSGWFASAFSYTELQMIDLEESRKQNEERTRQVEIAMLGRPMHGVVCPHCGGKL